MSDQQRLEIIRYVARLIDYGGGFRDGDFDNMTLGDIADKIIAVVRSEGE